MEKKNELSTEERNTNAPPPPPHHHLMTSVPHLERQPLPASITLTDIFLLQYRTLSTILFSKTVKCYPVIRSAQIKIQKRERERQRQREREREREGEREGGEGGRERGERGRVRQGRGGGEGGRGCHVTSVLFYLTYQAYNQLISTKYDYDQRTVLFDLSALTLDKLPIRTK